MCKLGSFSLIYIENFHTSAFIIIDIAKSTLKNIISCNEH